MKMEISGIIFLVFAWSAVIGLLVYCFTKVLKSERKNRKS